MRIEITRHVIITLYHIRVAFNWNNANRQIVSYIRARVKINFVTVIYVSGERKSFNHYPRTYFNIS